MGLCYILWCWWCVAQVRRRGLLFVLARKQHWFIIRDSEAPQQTWLAGRRWKLRSLHVIIAQVSPCKRSINATMETQCICYHQISATILVLTHKIPWRIPDTLWVLVREFSECFTSEHLLGAWNCKNMNYFMRWQVFLRYHNWVTIIQFINIETLVKYF